MNDVETKRLGEDNKTPKLDKAAAKGLLKSKDRLQRECDNTQTRFKTVFEQSVFGNKFINANLEIIKVNKALLKILGYTRKELLGSLITDIAHPDFVEHWKKLQHTLWIDNKRTFSIDTCLIKKDKTTVWCHVTSISFQDEGELLGYTIIEDISERKNLEQKLQEANMRQLQFRQQLLESTIDAQEIERSNIAEDVHNSLAQLLYSMKLGLGQIDLQSLERKQENETAFENAADVLNKCIKECRRISYELMPSALEYFGLKPAIEDLCKQAQKSIELKSLFTGLQERLPKQLEIAIYRIVQELTSNVIKHAGATKALINLSFKKEAVIIRVEDNGIGFSKVKVDNESVRIRSIENKLHLLDAKLDISARSGGGSVVTVQFSNQGRLLLS